MVMTHRERLETAWAFREPDRVPIEMPLTDNMRELPEAGRLVKLIEEQADNFCGAPGAGWGFVGFPATYHEEVIEDRPGEFRRIRRVYETTAGAFTAVTYHPAGENDYHWEKRYVATPEDLDRLATTPRAPLTWDAAAWRAGVNAIGDTGMPIVGLLHPLGFLVRHATMEEVYAWFHEHRELMHRFLAASNKQVADTIRGMTAEGIGPAFVTYAHEMLIPPWMGHRLFDEFVFPYDKAVNDAIHAGGCKLRAHCHGRCMDFLVKMADMGVDAIEPLEHPPRGDVDLAEAKRLVGDRMMLSGNVASESFVRMTPAEVRRETRDAIRAAARGGGFSIHTSGGGAGLEMCTSRDEKLRVVRNCEEFMLAALEYGPYAR